MLRVVLQIIYTFCKLIVENIQAHGWSTIQTRSVYTEWQIRMQSMDICMSQADVQLQVAAVIQQHICTTTPAVAIGRALCHPAVTGWCVTLLYLYIPVCEPDLSDPGGRSAHPGRSVRTGSDRKQTVMQNLRRTFFHCRLFVSLCSSGRTGQGTTRQKQ